MSDSETGGRAAQKPHHGRKRRFIASDLDRKVKRVSKHA